MKHFFRNPLRRKLFILPVSVVLIGAGFLFWNLLRTEAASGTVRPDGDVSVSPASNWQTCTPNGNGNCRFGVVDESSEITGDLIQTGNTAGGTGEVEEFTMTSVAGSTSQVTQVIVRFQADVAACNGNSTNCDTVGVQIRIDGGLEATQTVTMSATDTLHQVTFNGNWTGDDDLQVRLTRNLVGGGNQNNADDDVRLYQLYADVTYSPVTTVGTTGSQTSEITLGSTNQHIGGAFTMSNNTGTITVSSITLTEQGTINASSHLSNVDIYYETSGTCTYDGNETPFGTDTTLSSEQAVVTGTMSVGTSQVCIYVVLDVSVSASVGQTIEMEISNPSAQVSVSDGAVSPGTAVAISGTTVLEGGPTKIIFTTPLRSFQSNACNGSANVFTMQLQDDSDVATNPIQSTVVRVTSDSTGEIIYSDDTCSTVVANGDFTFSTSENTKSVYIVDSGAEGAYTLTGTRQSGDTLTTGTSSYSTYDISSKIRGGVQFRGGTTIR